MHHPDPTTMRLLRQASGADAYSLARHDAPCAHRTVRDQRPCSSRGSHGYSLRMRVALAILSRGTPQGSSWSPDPPLVLHLVPSDGPRIPPLPIPCRGWPRVGLSNSHAADGAADGVLSAVRAGPLGTFAHGPAVRVDPHWVFRRTAVPFALCHAWARWPVLMLGPCSVCMVAMWRGDDRPWPCARVRWVPLRMVPLCA